MRETFLYSILFLLCFSIGFCQTENSKRKIELIPPSSSSFKKLDIGSKNPNYFSIKKNDDPNSSNKTSNQKINLQSTTQIKNVSQEIESPKQNLNQNNLTSKINSFEELISLVEKNKEIELKFDLERNVRLVKFSEGKIDIEFNEKLSKNFIKNLTSRLLEWTRNRWIITLSKSKGDQTIYEKKNEVKKMLFEDAKKTEIYKKIMELFPNAELTNVEEAGKKEEDI